MELRAVPTAGIDHHLAAAHIQEGAGCRPLEAMLGAPLELGRFLSLAIGLAAALRELHGRGIIHKDVKPANVLVDAATGQVSLTGFGIASRLRRERHAPEPPEVIAGTLPYMAPEQTGRMNRSIDLRSDLYSLGVTLYEMLTGRLPFIASDPMEWVHCHIARQPAPPAEQRKEVPHAVSAIVMRLLAKTPEERYQTAGGVERDLRRCLAAWKAQCRIDDFPLGEHDMPDRLVVPEKLYGRTREVEALLAAFDRIMAGGRPELVLVSGYSGIGKSSVVNELHRVLVPPRGLFASGKFDQYKRDIPYATIAQAFQNLIQSLLAKSEAELARWRAAFLEALEPNGRLMVDLVPKLALIIGEQPPVPELPPRDAQRRFQFVLQRFIGVFARQEHPLALFLDDLQWIDAATLDLLEDLLTRSALQHLMLIGAYRDNEVTAAHPLTRKLEAIRNAGASVQDVKLAPLAREDVGRLVGDALRCDAARTAPLPELVHGKTAGNPFFVIQFLSALADEGLLAFDHGAARWSWDVGRIHAKGYTDNVVDLMVGKLSRLPARTQEALQQLACLGNRADLATLALLRGTPQGQVHADLWEAVRLELVDRLDDGYRFVHDRVQEAAYSLIAEASRAQAHLRIGRLLAAQTPPEKREETIFEIVNHLNRGAPLIASQDEREQLAELNLIAGKRAKGSSAYASALVYLSAGAALLRDDAWERRQALIFALELHRAECEFLTGELVAAEARLTMLASRAATTVEQATVACQRIDLYITLDRSDRAVEVALTYLRHLGVEWSAHPTEEEARREYQRTWALLGSREIEELIDLPVMSDPVSLATLDVLTKLALPALYAGYDNLYSLAICRAVNLSLEHGNTDASCFGYVTLGSVVAGPRFGDYASAFRFGQLACDLVDQRGFQRFKARTYLVFGNLVVPWTKHVRTRRDLVRRAFDVANAIGDLPFSTLSCNHLITNFLAAGDPLADVQREAEEGLEFAEKGRFGLVIDRFAGQLGLIRTLRGLTPTFGCFNDERFDELRVERHLSSSPMLAIPECWYWIRKLQARFFAGDYASAVEASVAAQRLLWTSPSFFEMAEAHFYGALSRAAACDAALPAQYQQHAQALSAHHRQLLAWAEHGAENFANRAALVGAEIARLEGRALDAERLYEEAIRSARENGFVHNEALANELASRFYAARGFETIAHAYLRNARNGYLRWGADGKVRQLDEKYPHLGAGETAPAPTSTIAAPVAHLDLATVLKVSQAVSGEIVLEKLIDTLLRTAIEQAGAERGLLILSRGDELSIAAEANTSGDTVTVRVREGPVTASEFPESVVHYAARTQESVLLDDASAPSPFSTDEYIRRAHARSVLCLPLVKQGRLVALLYLENRLASSVFTPSSIALLNVLASQAAISLENSGLYRKLQQREAEIRRLFDANIVGIVFWEVDGGIRDANDAFLRMVGYERADLVAGRLRWTDLTPREWLKRDREYAEQQVRLTGRVQPYEKEFLRKDGSRVPVFIGGAAFDAEIKHGVAFVVDITERKRAEEELRRSQHYLAETQKVSHTGSWAWSPVSNTLLYWSEECYRILGYDPVNGLPSFESSFERIHPEDRPALTETIARAVQEKAEFQVEYRLVLPDGTRRNVRILSQPVLDASGKLVEFIGTVMDITEQKRAEEERREHLWFLACMDRVNRAMQRTNDLEAMTSGVLDETLAIFGCDRAWLVYPCDPHAAACRAVMEHTRPEYPGAFVLGERFPVSTQAAETMRRLLDTPGALTDPSISPELRERFNIQSSIAIAVRPRGDRAYLLGLHQCTHARTWTAAERRLFEEIAHRLEDALTGVLAHRNLLASEERYARAMEGSDVGHWDWSIVTDEMFLSERARQMLVLPDGALPRTRMAIMALVPQHPDDLAGWNKNVAEGIAAGRYEREYRVIPKPGEVRWIRACAKVFKDGHGVAIRMVGSLADITESKLAEGALRASEERYSLALDATEEGHFDVNIDKDEVLTSAPLNEIYGFPPGTRLVKRSECLKGFPFYGNDAEIYHAEIRAAEAKGGPERYEFEYRILRSSGEVRWLRTRGKVTRDAEGRARRRTGVVADITERKRAEDALRASEQRYSLAMDAAEEGHFDLNIDTGELFISERLNGVYGFAPGTRFANRREYLDTVRLYPEDADKYHAEMAAAVADGGPERYEFGFRIVRPSGELRWLWTRGKVTRDAEGRAHRRTGVIADITARKLAEEAHRNHLWFLESMDRINRAMQRSNELELMMSGVLEETMAIFGSDRARLVYPCDPDAAISRVVMEHSRPEYPGAFAIGEEVPMDRHAAEFVRRVLDSPGAATVLSNPPEMRERFRVQSAIAIAVRPKGDRPYLFGLHQCSHARIWTAAERRLFEEIARRLEDTLTSVLAHRNLLASEERFALALETSEEGHFDADLETGEIFVSARMNEINGFARQPTIADRIEYFNQIPFHPDDRHVLADILRRESEHGTYDDYEFECRIVSRPGEVRWVHARGKVMRDAEGRARRRIGIIADITARKIAEEALLDARERLAQASKIASLAELSASIAHEINQPLQAIVANGHASLRWLDATPPNIEKAIRTAKRVVRDGNAAAEVVSRIRALFKHAAPAKVDLDINELILQVRTLMADDLHGNAVSLETQLGEDLPRIRADAVQIQQVIVNLARNAIEAMAEAPRKPLLIRSRRSASHVVVDVRDAGTGLVDPGKIFEPFVSTKPTGMGMGLPICRSITEAHGGGIWVVRNEGPGVTFSFSLPIEATKAT